MRNDEMPLIDGDVGGGLSGGVLPFELCAIFQGRLDAGHVIHFDGLKEFQGGAGEGRCGLGMWRRNAQTGNQQAQQQATQPFGCVNPLPTGWNQPV